MPHLPVFDGRLLLFYHSCSSPVIRVTINACKDLLKSFFHSRTVPLDLIPEQPAELMPDHREVLEAVLSLPQKYRDVVYLHYSVSTSFFR